MARLDLNGFVRNLDDFLPGLVIRVRGNIRADRIDQSCKPRSISSHTSGAPPPQCPTRTDEEIPLFQRYGFAAITLIPCDAAPRTEPLLRQIAHLCRNCFHVAEGAFVFQEVWFLA